MTAPPKGELRTYSLGAVLPHVRTAAQLVGNMYGIATIGGWRASARDPLGHPAGRALDFMCSKSQGDAVNAFLLANAEALGVDYTIWQQTYFKPGKAPEPMEDRGSPTQNHFDHVHANFNVMGGSGPITDVPKKGVASSVDGGGIFDGWADGLLGIGVQLAATGAALALVVIGVKKTVKND